MSLLHGSIRIAARSLVVLIGAAVFLTCGEPRSARAAWSGLAEGACPEWTSAWVEACHDSVDGAVRIDGCADDVYLFELDIPGGSPLRVEVKATGQAGLRTIGPLSISPVGDFPDWYAEPEAVRAAFDAFADCGNEVLAEPGVREAIADRAARGPSAPNGAYSGARRDGRTSVPWLLCGAVLLLAATAAAGLRRERRADIVAATLLVVAALVVRPLVFPMAYFHQNGQGPLWIEYGMGASGPYGPGFHEVFGLFVARAADPDRVLIAVQTAFAALVPASLYVLSRSVGAPRTFAGALSALAIVEPGLGRLARGESYFAIWVSLLTIATAVVVASVAPTVAARPLTLRSRTAFVAAAGTVAAGLFLAQAARVHPVGWPAAALVPLAVVTLPGPWTRRVGVAAAVGIGIGLVVAATSLPAMLRVLGGALGDHWLPNVQSSAGHTNAYRLAAAVGGAFALGSAGAWSSARGWARIGAVLDGLAVLLVGAVPVAVHAATNVLASTPPQISHAVELLFLGVPVAAVAALCGRLVRAWRPATWVLVPAVVAGCVAYFAQHWADLTRLPTDAREALLVRDWRDELPEGATVFYLERVDKYVFRLPVYPNVGRATRRVIEPDMPINVLTDVVGSGYWYRSSLCSTWAGTELCDSVHSELALEPVFTTSLPAIPSLAYLPYDRDTVDVGLYRILGRADAVP